MSAPAPGSFEPKEPVKLNPPKDDPIETSYLAKCDGTNAGYPVYVAIKGVVFDVTGNPAYAPGNKYHVFTGKDPSRALAKSSVKPEDCVPQWSDLPDKEKGSS
uniref:Cytochrome b5 heme-binding domain-containing protein n=1 Tax=Medicago truncatula TaxID=3880 RepID=I3SZW6_MEDTR|nr:unknown [Medicago truncatula]